MRLGRFIFAAILTFVYAAALDILVDSGFHDAVLTRHETVHDISTAIVIAFFLSRPAMDGEWDRFTAMFSRKRSA